MGMSTSAIREMTLRATSEGFPETTKKVEGLTLASGVLATVTDVVTKRTISAEGAYKRQTLAVVEGARAEDQLARALKVVESAMNQGLLTTAQHAERVALLQKKYGEAGAAARTFEGAHEGALRGFENLAGAAEMFGLALGAGAFVEFSKHLFETTAHMSDMAMPFLPVEALQAMVTEKVISGTRPLMGLAPLLSQIESLRTAISQRSLLLEELRQVPQIPLELYFGLKQPNGPTDQRYPNSIEQLVEYTDGILYFLERLADLLMEHGARVQKKFWRAPPKLVTIQLDDKGIAPYRPDPAKFPTWERMTRLRHRQDRLSDTDRFRIRTYRRCLKALRRARFFLLNR